MVRFAKIIQEAASKRSNSVVHGNKGLKGSVMNFEDHDYAKRSGGKRGLGPGYEGP